MAFLLTLIFLVVAAVVVAGVLKANRRMHYANARRAARAVTGGASGPPSWVGDDDRVEEFLYVVQNLAVHKGVPRTFATRATSTLTSINFALAHCAGAMEAQGATFNAQKLAAADLLVDLWSNSSSEERELMLADASANEAGATVSEAPSSNEWSLLERVEYLTDKLSSFAQRGHIYQPRTVYYRSAGTPTSPKAFVEDYFAKADSEDGLSFLTMRFRPSWVQDSDKLKSFISYLFTDASLLGIPETYVVIRLLSQESFCILLGCAASAEYQGFNFRFQQDLGVAIVKRGWDDWDEEQKAKAQCTTLDADAMDYLAEQASG